MRKILLGLWIGLSAVCPLLAQEGDGGDKARAAKGRVAWFVQTSIPEGLENPVSVMSGKDIIQVSLSKRSPSEPLKIPSDGILRLVRKVENPADPTKPEYLTLAQAQIPDSVSKALIILLPVAENPKGLVFQARVQDLASFRGGECLYINMTKLRVGVEVGKTSVEIKPGEVKISDGPTPSEPVNMPIRYSYFDPANEKWKMLSASTIVIYPTRREICIFSWDPRFDRMDYHGITFPVM
jgi:hypothetical protein